MAGLGKAVGQLQVDVTPPGPGGSTALVCLHCALSVCTILMSSSHPCSAAASSPTSLASFATRICFMLSSGLISCMCLCDAWSEYLQPVNAFSNRRTDEWTHI